MNQLKPKILVILGPTASGKSGLAVKLAKKLNGEVISADSRQVYTGLDIGTGKITKEEMNGVPHHLLDVADPKNKFTVVNYVELATKAVDDVIKRGKLPIICGGTGFYIQALVDGTIFPEVPMNESLRIELAHKDAAQLLAMLTKLDPDRAKEIAANPSDSKNARRIMRAVEIASAGLTTKPVPAEPKYDPAFIGINPPLDVLKEKIHTRLLKRLAMGMLDEVKSLHTNGLSWERMEELGLEYRFLARYLQGQIPKAEMIRILTTEIGQYAKRQMTWFKRDARIQWFENSSDPKISEAVEKSI